MVAGFHNEADQYTTVLERESRAVVREACFAVERGKEGAGGKG